MISIVTPTYNRGKLLVKLYDSLNRQLVYDFEWIIVDDGSIDNTYEIVCNFQKECLKFPIQYIKKENGGKHTAINTAMKYVKGKFTFIVDSDDYLSNDAIITVEKWCKEIEDDENIAGVSGLRSYKCGKVIGGKGLDIKKECYVEATNLQRKKYDLMGDKAEIYKTDILRKYPFPVFKNEKFLSEEAVWNSIANDGYLIRWYNKVIYYTEYLEDGLTFASKYKNLELNNFCGYSYTTKQNLKFYKKLKTKSMIFINYYKLAREKNNDFKDVCKILDINVVRGTIYFVLGKIGCNILRMLG